MVVAIVLILTLALGTGAHDGWLESGKVRARRHRWEVTWVGGAVRREGHMHDETREDECLKREEEKQVTGHSGQK